jgi:hypothetical protein
MKKLIIYIVFTFVTFLSVAQKPFLSMTENPDKMTDRQQEAYNAIMADEEMSNTNYTVAVSPLKDAVDKNGVIILDVPYLNCIKPRFRAVSVQYKSEEDYIWIGKIPDEDECQCWDGELTIVSRYGMKTASLRLDGQMYVLNDLTSNYYLLSKIRAEKLKEYRCGVEGQHSEIEVDNQIEADDRNVNTNCDVRVLFLFTPKAGKSQGTNINSTVDMALAKANQTFINSAINPISLNLVKAGVFPLKFVETFNVNKDLADFQALPEVIKLRQQYGADLVILITNSGGAYKPTLGLSAGSATNPNPNPANGFALFEEQFVASTNVFTHEIGHLFGCLHETCDPNNSLYGSNNICDNTTGDAHAHTIFWKEGGFCNKTKKSAATIMYSIADSRVIPNFSNPEVDYKQKPTGIKDKRNNKLKLVTQACNVATFVNTFTPGVSGIIEIVNGSSFNCFGTTVTVDMQNITGAPGNVTISWEKSIDGVNYTFLGTGQGVSVYLAKMPQPYNVTLRAKITDSAGNTFTAFRSFGAGPCGSTSKVAFSNQVWDINPNPSQDLINISFEVETSSKFEISIYDGNGKLVKSVSKDKIEVGAYNEIIDVSNFPNGILNGKRFWDKKN